MKQIRNPILAGILLLVIHAILASLFLYVQYPVLDIPMHFLGGVIVAWFFAVYFKEERKAIPPLAELILIVGGTAVVGVAWEWMEWVVDNIFLPNHPFMGGLDDTLFDLAMDLLGACVVALAVRRKKDA